MTNTILALTFATPWIAWTGLGLATVPVLIHLLNRRRFRLVDWAAMRFLLDSRRRNRRRLRFEELLLLALRCLLILLIALAVARPMADRAMAMPGTRAVTDHVFVLDDSYSMGVRRGEASVFDAAVQELAGRIEELPVEDQVAVYRTSDRGAAWRPLGHPGGREAIERLASEVRALPLSDTHAGLPETLAAVRRDLQDAGAARHERRVVLLSDFRRPDYADPQGRQLRAPLAGLAEDGVELTLVDHGPPVAQNLAVEDVRLRDKHALVSDAATVAVTIRNHGQRDASDVRLTVRIGEVELVRGVDQVPSGQAVTVDVPVAFPAAGPTVIEAQLPDDALAADNVARQALDVREALAVLILDGEPDTADPQRSEAFYLAAALDPAGDGSFGVRPEIRPAEQAGAIDFGAYDVVVMANVASLPDVDDELSGDRSALTRLKDYVRGGGGLIVFTGERVNLAWYGRVLFEDGGGLLPLRLAAPVGDAERRDAPVSFRPGSAADIDMLRIFQGEANVFMDLVRVYRFHRTEPPPSTALPEGVGPARVLMRFADDDASAALVERTYGDGLAVLVTTTADAAWNDWPKSINFTYQPVMYDMIGHVAAGRKGQYTARVGEPIAHVLPAVVGEVRATMRTPRYPQEEPVSLNVEADALGRRQVRYAFQPRPGVTAAWAGVYTLTLTTPDGAERSLPFARNVEPAEGDLEKAAADRAELARLLGTEEFAYLDRTAPAPALAEVPPAREYWRWALAAILGALALEVFLAQRFGHYPARTLGGAR